MAKKAPTKNASDLRSLSYADRMKWWTHDRFGMFIHWGLYSIKAKHEWIRNYEKISNEAYQVYFDEFDPVRFDPDLWAAVAKAAGQKYAVLTAKHHEGFCLFDSRHTDYKATNTPAGRDLVREYVDAFRAAGLKVGFYYSLIDWHHPDYPCDHLHPMRDDAEYKARPRDFNRYLDYMHAQVKELCTNYGQIDVMWFDFSYGEMSGEKWRARQLVDMIRKYQPNVIIDNRLTLGHVDPKARGLGDLGDFCSPECIIPSEGMRDADGKPVCWESCITLNANWGYNRDDAGYKSPRDAVRMLVECVSKGGNLLLNVGPNPLGEIPDDSIERLAAVGRWMDRNGASIYGCGLSGYPKPEWGYFTRNGRMLYAHVLDWPVGSVALPNLGGKIKKARLLRDGSEVNINQPWNVSGDSPHAFLTVGINFKPDPYDTVVALELKE